MLDSDVAAALRTHLGRGRSGVAHAADEQARLLTRERVGLAKHGLGERGEPWWEMTAAARRRRAEEALAELARLDAPDAPSIRDAILDLLSRRAESRTVCPSDIARALHVGPGWRGLMDPVRDVATGLVADGVVVATRGGTAVDPANPGGPVRLGRGPRWAG